MGIIVDLIIVLFLLVFVFLGYKKGLTGSIIKLLSFIIAIVISIMFCRPVANYVNRNTEIDDKIKTSIIDIFDKQEDDVSTEEEEEKEKEKEEEGIKEIIFKEISEDIKNAANETKTQVVNQSADRITETIINVGAAIAIYLVVRLVLIIVSFFIKGITELPIIKQVDKIGGVVYGLVEGMIIIYVIFGIISFITLALPENNISSTIEKSAIGGTIYNNNLILNLLIK